uniref:Claudin domain containing 1 n=4 Tax=Nothobranchius TaxID=28779 RepID=A0A1A8AF50_NOTFU
MVQLDGGDEAHLPMVVCVKVVVTVLIVWCWFVCETALFLMRKPGAVSNHFSHTKDLCCFPSDPKMETHCVSFTLPQQFKQKYKYQEDSPEDLLRTYLWRCQFLLPLVSLALVFLSGLVGVCACLCRSFTPTLVVGVLHFLAGLCSLGTVCCFRAGVDLLHHNHEPPSGVDGSMGWSLYLALISFPLQMMAAALFLWAAKSHRKSYTRMVAYRVA